MLYADEDCRDNTRFTDMDAEDLINTILDACDSGTLIGSEDRQYRISGKDASSCLTIKFINYRYFIRLDDRYSALLGNLIRFPISYCGILSRFFLFLIGGAVFLVVSWILVSRCRRRRQRGRPRHRRRVPHVCLVQHSFRYDVAFCECGGLSITQRVHDAPLARCDDVFRRGGSEVNSRRYL